MMKTHYLFYLILLFALSCNNSNNNDNKKNTTTNTTTIQQDTQKTISSLTIQIRKNPNNAKLFFKRATLYASKKLIDSAIYDMQIAIKLDSLIPDYYLRLAEFFLMQGKSGKTKNILERCITQFPNNDEAKTRLGELYFYVKDYNTALKYLNEAREIAPNNARNYFIRGLLYQEKVNLKKAIENFQITVEKDPDYYDAYIALAFIFNDKKDSIAIAYFNNAIRLQQKSFEAHYGLAMFYQENERVNQAIDEYNYILSEIDSLNKNVYFNIGYIHLIYKNNYEEAIRFFSKAIELDENYTEAYYNRGYCYELLKEFDKAKKEYKKALRLKDNYELAIKGLKRIS